MRRLLVAGLTLVALVSCGSEDEPPDVDWSAVPQNQRVSIEEAVESGDCQRMQTYFDGSKNADVLSFLNWHMEDAGCYE